MALKIPSGMSLVQYFLASIGRGKKPQSPFASEKEAYEFCERVYRETGGVAPDLKRAFEFYEKNFNDDCPPTAGHPHT